MALPNQNKVNPRRANKNQVPFRMARENRELLRECCPEHLHKRTARVKYDKETEGGKQKRVNLSRIIIEVKFLTGEASAQAGTISSHDKASIPLSMATGNGELMHECFSKHFAMGTIRMK